MAAVGAIGLLVGALSDTWTSDVADAFEGPAMILGVVFLHGSAGVGWVANLLQIRRR